MNNNKIQQIGQTWTLSNQRFFTTNDNETIEYLELFSEENNRCVVIVPGRSESYLKYKELIHDFYSLGFNVVVIDHRGQGLSSRSCKNRQKGYVRDFAEYASDLEQLTNLVVARYPNNKYYLLAHSMGGAIAATYLQNTRHTPFEAAVLTSPMLGINLGKTPRIIAQFIGEVGDYFNQLLSKEPWYMIGQGDYEVPEFTTNKLTHSKTRFDNFVDLYQDEPQLQLGGVTFRWFKEALKQTRKLTENQSKISVPTLVFQAGLESIVDNMAQRAYCQRLHQANTLSCPSGKPIIFEKAKHEILFENDDVRDLAINTIEGWFNRFS